MKRIFYLLFALLSLSASAQDLLMQQGAQASFPSRDKTGPTFASGNVETVTPNLIMVHLSDAHNVDTQTPSNTQWTVSGVASLPIITAQVIDGNAKTIELTLSGNIVDSDIPLLTYTNPGDGTGIKDVLGNFTTTFSNQSITNNTGTLPTFSGNANLQWLFTSTGFSGTSTVEDRSSNNNDGTLVKSNCLTSDGTTVLTFSSLSGITITSWEGTSTLTKSGNTITTTSGTFYHIILSNGTSLPCADGSGSIVYDATATGLNGTLSGTINWTGTQDTYHYNILNGFSHLGAMDAINQYVALSSNINPGAGKFSLKVIYAPASITTGQDILGTGTTANRWEINTSAGNINGVLRLGSGATYTLTCASSAAIIGYANNTFSTFILTRNALGDVTCTLNGFTLLIDGAASVNDASSSVFSQLMRTSTSNGNIGILKEVEILDHATTSLIGTKYNADNNFLGTLTGGFALRKYPRPQGGDGANRNASGNWHNGAETLLKPNPSGNATLQTATGWSSSTELSYADLSTVADPSFCNVLDPIKKRNLASWTTALPYEDEITANNFVGKTTININTVTGWSTSNRLGATASTNYNANATGFTVKLVVRPPGAIITTSQIIFGKTAAVSGNGWAIEAIANAAGSDISLRVKNGAGTVTRSRAVTFSERETDLTILHFVIRVESGTTYMYTYRNGMKQNSRTTLVGITNGTDDLVIGAFSGGNAFTSGVIAAAAYENHGMTDNEVEASYQATKNNAYTQEDGITLLFGSESGNANWANRVTGTGGTPTLTKSGTLTATSINQVFNKRWRPEDYTETTSALALTPIAAPKIMCLGDSRVLGVGDGTGGITGFRQELLNLCAADGDISAATMVGPQGSPPINHYGLSGKTSSSLISESPGLGSVLVTADPDIIIVFIGTNATGSSSLYNQEITEHENIFHYARNNLGSDVRIIVVEELEHEDANRRARLEDLSDYRWRITYPDFISKGFNMVKCHAWRTITIQNGQYDDVVHLNAAGYAALAALIFPKVKMAAGYAP